MNITYQVKKTIVLLFAMITWPITLPTLLEINLRGKDNLFGFFSKLLSLIPGHIGQYIRTSFYVFTLKKCHYDLAVGFGSFFAQSNVEVGRKVGLGCYSIVGTSIIGNNVYISSRVSILSGKYQHSTGALSSVTDGVSAQFKSIQIGSSTWLGENSVIMANVGDNCIISAGSVVTKNLPNNTTAIGNPARILNREI